MGNLKDELIELQTIFILLDDKLHKYQGFLNKLKERIEKLEEIIKTQKGDE